MRQLQKIIETIKQYRRFVILMHEQPDGDTVACSLAFANALRQMDKHAICVSKDPLPKPFRFLPESKAIQSDFLAGDYDVMILLDCGDLRRTGFPERVKRFANVNQKVIHVDHHQKSDLYKLANIKLFDGSASATSEILYPLFQCLPITINADIATCLLTSLYYDTGAFKHANTTNQVLRLAAQLLHQGARLREITKHVELTKSVAGLKLWGVALSRAKRHSRLNVITSCITRADLLSCKASESDAAGIVNLLNAVPGTKAAILLLETADGKIRGSLRTEHPKIDVAALAALFGGGGLRKASGFSLAGRLQATAKNWRVNLE